MDNVFVIITARGGSKGIPGKNLKPLCGKPLIYYSIDAARAITGDENICMTTDSEEIAAMTEAYGLKVPFLRPAELATDTAHTGPVMAHALEWYEARGRKFDVVLQLQPTSPIRKKEHIIEALALYRDDIDMVVSVQRAAANPYYDCFEEDENGFLHISKGDGRLIRRQWAPDVWQTNGSLFIMNPVSLKTKNFKTFEKIVKYPMPDEYSIDLDTPMDWAFAEFLLSQGNIEHI